MPRLLRYSTTYGEDNKQVVYWRPFDAADEEARKRANELNALDVNDELLAYNETCMLGKAGPVSVDVEEVDE